MYRIIIIVLLVNTSLLFGQKKAHLGVVYGYVKNNNQAVAYANVGIEGTKYGAATNEKGYFIINNIPYGAYNLTVSCIGYKTQKIKINVTDSVPVSFNLEELTSVMDEVVVTAQYEPTEVRNSVHKIKVISAKTIEQRGAVNLGDVLMQELNARIIHDNVLGRNIVLQGLSGQNVKILLDGIPLISGQANEFDLSQINLNNIERIEIIEGPLSVQYGTNALAGTVNLISKDLPDGKKVAVNLNTYYESVGQYNADITLGTTIKKKNKLSASFGRNRFEGFSSLDEERTMNWSPKTQYFTNIRYARKLKALNLGLTYNYFNESTLGLGVPTTTSSYAIATDRHNLVNRWNSNFFLNGKIKENYYIDMVGGYQEYQNITTKYLVNLADGSKKKTADPADHDTTTFDSWVFRGAISKKGILKDKITLQLGYDLNWSGSQGGRVNQSSTTLFDGGIFTSVNYSPIPSLEIRPAFRYVISNQFSTNDINFLSSGAPVIPSLNVKYKWKEKTQIRASYAKGFRSPSLRELYFFFHDANHSIDGNPDLTPETSDNFTFSIRHGLYYDKWSFNIEPSVFYNDMKDRIYLVHKETIALGDENKVNRTYLNIPYFRTQGGNLNFLFKYNNRLTCRVGQGVTIRSGSKSLSEKYYSYETSASLSYNIIKWNTKINGFYKYNGPLAEFSLVNGELVDRTIQDYNIFDLSVSKAFKENLLSITLGAKNLFNVIDVDQTGDGSDGILPRTGFKQKVPVSWGRTFFISLKLNIYK